MIFTIIFIVSINSNFIETMSPLNYLFNEIYKNYCYILTSDPAKHAIPKTAEVHIALAWASLADNMGQG